MADRCHDGSRELIVLALATSNLGVLLLAVLAALYVGGGLGELLGGLDTALGLGLFAALWALTWACTRGAVRGWRLDRPPHWTEACARGALWGGIEGVIVLLALVAVASLVGVVEQGPVILLGVLLYGSIGGVVAFVIGAAVGLPLALLNHALLAATSISERRA